MFFKDSGEVKLVSETTRKGGCFRGHTDLEKNAGLPDPVICQVFARGSVKILLK